VTDSVPTTAQRPSIQRPPLWALSFGAREQVEAICERLERAFRFAEKDGPLVVGLYGPWGCGKSLWLEHVHKSFAERLAALGPEAMATPTVPILFNAWQFEREPHLLIPLLRTVQIQLETWAREIESPAVAPSAAPAATAATPGAAPFSPPARTGLLRRVAGGFGKFAVAFAAGLEFDFGVVKVSGKDALDKAKELSEEEEKTAAAAATPQLTRTRSPRRRARSIYFDFQNELRRVTGHAGAPEAEKVNLLFLVDDLDRCLPEKAVQMLESIKLFLEVEGCCFVLAVDDEVIERGIVHRYRDYGTHGALEADAIAYSLKPARYDDFRRRFRGSSLSPITGAEYLEKIVHVPVRVAPPRDVDVPRFLQDRFPELFEVKVKLTRDPNESAGIAGADEAWIGTHPDVELLEFFRRAVPAVPRKLVRAAETLQLAWQVAQKNGADLDRTMLARFVLLQLFAPELYRFARTRYPAFLGRVKEWAADARWPNLAEIEEELRAKSKANDDGGNRSKKEPEERADARERLRINQFDLPLLTYMLASQQQRSAFDVTRLFDEELEVPEFPFSYFDLRPAPAFEPRGADERLEVATLADPTAFLAQMASNDPVAWKNALATESTALQGRILDDKTFASILNGVKEWKRPGSQDLDASAVLAWLETIEPHLSIDQFDQVYRETGLLRRLAAQVEPPKELARPKAPRKKRRRA